jgi:hypothetical protein
VHVVCASIVNHVHVGWRDSFLPSFSLLSLAPVSLLFHFSARFSSSQIFALASGRDPSNGSAPSGFCHCLFALTCFSRRLKAPVTNTVSVARSVPTVNPNILQFRHPPNSHQNGSSFAPALQRMKMLITAHHFSPGRPVFLWLTDGIPIVGVKMLLPSHLKPHGPKCNRDPWDQA